MYYFAYCTWLSDAELRKYVPEARYVTKAKAHNWQIQFRPPAAAPTAAGATCTT